MKASKRTKGADVNAEMALLIAEKETALIDSYEALVAENPDLKESHNRKEAIKAIRDMKSESLSVESDVIAGQNPILVTMKRRYQEYSDERYEGDSPRLLEWYTEGWKDFVRQEHESIIKVDPSSKAISHWSIEQAGEFIATQIALDNVESEHIKALEGIHKVTSDSSDSGPDQKAEGKPDIEFERKVRAVMLLEIMFHVGYKESQMNRRRLAGLMSYLEADMSKKSINRNAQALHAALLDKNQGSNGRHKNDLEKLKLFLNHFVVKGGPKDSFIRHIEKAIKEAGEK